MVPCRSGAGAFPLIDDLQESSTTYHVAIRAAHFEVALAPCGIPWGARVQSLRPEVLGQRIDASYPEDHTRPTVARALRMVVKAA